MNGASTELMQIVFWADVNHDDQRETLVIMSAYPEGSEPEIASTLQFSVLPGTIVHEQISAFIKPIKGEAGKTWRSKFVLVDQFRRKYKTQEIAFRFAGPVPPPESGTPTGNEPTPQ
jgi:hypothetical protein